MTISCSLSEDQELESESALQESLSLLLRLLTRLSSFSVSFLFSCFEALTSSRIRWLSGASWILLVSEVVGTFACEVIKSFICEGVTNFEVIDCESTAELLAFGGDLLTEVGKASFSFLDFLAIFVAECLELSEEWLFSEALESWFIKNSWEGPLILFDSEVCFEALEECEFEFCEKADSSEDDDAYRLGLGSLRDFSFLVFLTMMAESNFSKVTSPVSWSMIRRHSFWAGFLLPLKKINRKRCNILQQTYDT